MAAKSLLTIFLRPTMSIGRRSVLAVLTALTIATCATAAEPLFEREVDGHYLYYPPGENEIAGRLAGEIAGML